MRRVPVRLLVTTWLFALAALTVLAVAVAHVPVYIDGRLVLQTVLLFALLLLARFFPLHLTPKTKTTVGTAPLFAATLLLPVPLAMAVGAVATMAANTARRQVWFQTLFNTSEVALRVAAGGAVFALTAGTNHLVDLAPGRWMAGVLLTALVMYLVNGVLIDLMVGVQLRRAPFRDFWRRRQVGLPQEGTLFLLGLLVAAIAVRFPWAVALLVVPSFVVHRSLRDGVALKVQTREALEKLADIVDMRDHYTFEHSRRVAALARATAEELRLPADQVDLIEMAARVHDVGKIGIKSTILMKPDALTDREWTEMRSHAATGAQLVARFPEFARGREIVLSHHERYDGNGYPRGLAGEQIPLGARVLAVSDAWDAMTSHRAYRRALDIGRAYAELERGRGTQFDPVVLDAFLRVLATRPELATLHIDEEQDVDVPLPRSSQPSTMPH